MNQKQILRNRTINSIENIKYKLRKDDTMTVYNDLIIIRHILPHLEKQTLRGLLKEVKQIDKTLKSDNAKDISLSHIVEYLSSVHAESGLLHDFLKCTSCKEPLHSPAS